MSAADELDITRPLPGRCAQAHAAAIQPFWINCGRGRCPGMVRMRNIFAHVRAQLWLLPALMSIGGAALAYLAVVYGGLVSRAVNGSSWWLYSGDASTARDLLSAFLSGLLTMTSLVVSVTVVILTTAASQLGPRLITFFMADRQIQFVLGLFISTTLYVIVVLRTLDDKLGSEGVPHVAVTIASALTIACLFALLFYVHKIARSVVADNLVEEVWSALNKDIDQILYEHEPPPVELTRPADGPRVAVALNQVGYIQLVDYQQLVRLAQKRDVVIKIPFRAGHFVLAGVKILEVVGAQKLDADFTKELKKAFVIGSTRTPAQDIEHGLRQMVEIGLRALSPGINDPMTAIAVIDRLGAALEKVFARELPPRHLPDEKGTTRVIADRSDHRGIVAVAFNQLRQAGETQPAIIISIARTLGGLAAICHASEAEEALRDQLLRLTQTASAQNFAVADAADVAQSITQARLSLDGNLEAEGITG